MKNLFKATLTFAIAVVMISCGGADSANFVGSWTPDLSSVHVELSDVIPDDATDQVKFGLKDLKNQQEGMDEHTIFELKEGGELIIGEVDNPQHFKWKVDGNELHFFGELKKDVPPEFIGKEFDIALEILESSSDKFTLKLTAQSIYDQLKAQFPKDMEEAEDNLGIFKMLMTEKVMSETWTSVSFKKK